MKTFFDLRRELFRRHGKAIEAAVSLCSARRTGTDEGAERPSFLTAGIGPFAYLARFIGEVIGAPERTAGSSPALAGLVGPDGPARGEVILLVAGIADEPDALDLLAEWRKRGARIVAVAGKKAKSILGAADVAIPVKTDDPAVVAQAAIVIARYLERRRREAHAAADGVHLLIRFRCPACEEFLLADANAAGAQAICPFCGIIVALPDETGESYRVGREAFGEERRVALRFGMAECDVRYRPAGKDPDDGDVPYPVEDLSVTGLKFFLPIHRTAPAVGERLRLRIDIPAFLEPVFLDAEVRYVEASIEGARGPREVAAGGGGDSSSVEADPAGEEGVRVGVLFSDLDERLQGKLERLEEVALGGAPMPLLQ